MSDRDLGFREVEYSHFLCFKVSVRTNKLVYTQTCQYTPEQQELYNLIKSARDEGLGYRRISKNFNEKGIRTHKGNRWSDTGSSVYSVLKKYKQREERLELFNKEYEPVWGSMEVKWEKN